MTRERFGCPRESGGKSLPSPVEIDCPAATFFHRSLRLIPFLAPGKERFASFFHPLSTSGSVSFLIYINLRESLFCVPRAAALAVQPIVIAPSEIVLIPPLSLYRTYVLTLSFYFVV